jgi:predicted NAD/FAD-binding protein
MNHNNTAISATTTTTNNNTPQKKTICIVGSGVSGLVCAYLLSEEFDVTLVECAQELGMDSSSQDVDNARVDVPLRTFNEDYYQNLTRIYKEIGVEYAPPDYSFCCYYQDEPAHFRYTTWIRNWFTFGILGIEKMAFPGTSWTKLPRCLSHMYEFWNFMRIASRRLQEPNNGLDQITFKEYVLSSHSHEFYYELLLPMLSVICTCTHEAVGAYPAEILLDYLAGRAHLHPFGSNTQRAVSGTRDVVKRLSTRCSRVITNCKVLSILPAAAAAAEPSTNTNHQVQITWVIKNDVEQKITITSFNHVIIATQANSALELLGSNASEFHRKSLGAIRYERNRTVLHTDENVLPLTDRAVCNLGIDKCTGKSDCTIWMNKVDAALGSKFHRNVFQTWNPLIEPSKNKILFDTWFERPVMTIETNTALDLLASIQGQGNLWFIGAYSLYSMPLLENGTRSAIRVANRLLENKKIPEIGRQISGLAFERRRPDLVSMCVAGVAELVYSSTKHKDGSFSHSSSLLSSSSSMNGGSYDGNHFGSTNKNNNVIISSDGGVVSNSSSSSATTISGLVVAVSAAALSVIIVWKKLSEH